MNKATLGFCSLAMVLAILFPSATRGEEEVRKILDLAAKKVWRIGQPDVEHNKTKNYPQIGFDEGDRVRVEAGGCAQTGGLVGLPDLTSTYPESREAPGLVRIADLVGEEYEVPALNDDSPEPHYLRLGYEGDDCEDLGSAWVEVTIQRPAAETGQTRTWSFRLPEDGTMNNNKKIGPFCCTGWTAIVRGPDDRPVGYIYFYGWAGQAYNCGHGKSIVPDLIVLVSGLANLTDSNSPMEKSQVQFTAAKDPTGTNKSTEAGALRFNITLEKAEIEMRGRPYFVMGSQGVRVDVSAAAQ
jgi:hypothetical protein